MIPRISHRHAAGAGRLPIDACHELSKLAVAQRRLLPQHPPEVPGYALVLAYRPAYVATGDYHDFFQRPDGQRAAFIGDGSGHGPATSLLVATMRAILRTHPDRHTEPGQTLAFAGRTLAALTSSGEFMTGVYLVLEGEGRLAWASAGHDPPLRISRCGRVAPVDLSPVGLPLGIEPGEEYATVRWQLEPGERLVLFTDGLVEACNADGERFGRDRFQSVVSELAGTSLTDTVRELVVRTATHCEGADFEDDFTILGIERRAGAFAQAPDPSSPMTRQRIP